VLHTSTYIIKTVDVRFVVLCIRYYFNSVGIKNFGREAIEIPKSSGMTTSTDTSRPLQCVRRHIFMSGRVHVVNIVKGLVVTDRETRSQEILRAP
jgi:hypothetical protein